MRGLVDAMIFFYGAAAISVGRYAIGRITKLDRASSGSGGPFDAASPFLFKRFNLFFGTGSLALAFVLTLVALVTG